MKDSLSVIFNNKNDRVNLKGKAQSKRMTPILTNRTTFENPFDLIETQFSGLAIVHTLTKVTCVWKRENLDSITFSTGNPYGCRATRRQIRQTRYQSIYVCFQHETTQTNVRFLEKNIMTFPTSKTAYYKYLTTKITR